MNSNRRFTDFVKSNFLQVELREILQSPTGILLGVSDKAEDVLKTMQIFTVFDLAMSRIFAVAGDIATVSEIPQNMVGRYGKAPSEMVDHDYRDKDVSELINGKLSIINGIGGELEKRISAELGVNTIRELALWNPYLMAKVLVDLSLNPEGLTAFDAQSPADLIPKTGEFPTDKVYYSSVVLIDAPANELRDLDGPIDLTADTQGFTKPATGAVLTYSQTWSPKAVTLGQLLYSLPLAPGESTKIAIIDFARRSLGRTQEDIAQTENLSNTMVQSRSISEIARAVASETQDGTSDMTSNSDSEAVGAAAGGFISPVLFGMSGGASRNFAHVHTYTTSKGDRDLSASTQQRISNSRQQNAFSERNKKAAIITEASQEEREQITTRTVTNYNHMHALSIQYYEVVQLYQTQVRVEKCERCLFIPMRIFKFNEDHISRFRSTFYRYALNQRVRQLLINAAGSVSAKLELKPAYEFTQND